ncbi:MAG: DNA replication/repair protein RecF [Hyphomicrobiaceae bacterium]|nr:DNA replication/repair protein RecF [Hyphomicrobiaceae bacterium]
MSPPAVSAAAPAAATPPLAAGQARQSVWIERLRLSNFRNYAELALDVGPGPIVLTGPNGAGKTNLMEAVSLLSPGQGLRRSPYAELTRLGASSWAVASTLRTPHGPINIGTGFDHHAAGRSGRVVRIDGESRSGSGALASDIEVLWLIPAMDGLFIGPAGERRRFLDRLIPSFDPGYRARLAQFERAMQHRNRLLAEDVREEARFAGLERVMAETGAAVAAARAAAVAALAATIAARREASPTSPFPWADLAIVGTLEADLATRPAVDVEDAYAATLQATRERDRAAGRTLDGPHRSDLIVGHGPKSMPAGVCSTGEQKALLIGLVLAHADHIRRQRDGRAPILLLDEIAAHLDPPRRAALFVEIMALGGQTWMTGTDPELFSALAGMAQFHRVEEGRVAQKAVTSTVPSGSL